MKGEERHAQLELCIPYVFGRLNPGNRKQFEAHVATGCEQCQRELSALYEATALLPLLLRQEQPPAGLKQRLLSRTTSKRPEQPRGERGTPQRGRVEAPTAPTSKTPQPQRPWYLYVSVVMGILIIISLAVFVNDLVHSTSVLEKRIVDLEGDAQQNLQLLELLKAQKMEMLPLAGTELGSKAYGKIFWDPATRNALLLATNLPVESGDKQYQLWISREKKFVSVGTFDVTSENDRSFKSMTLPIGDRKEIDEFTVTQEPRGGSTQPSGTIYLRGLTR